METRGWNKLKAFAYLAFAVLLSAALELFVLAYNPPRYALPLDGPVSARRDGLSLGSLEIPFLNSCGSNRKFIPGFYTYAMEFELPADLRREKNLALVFPQIAGASLSVSANGTLLGRRGDPAEGRATIWNAVHVFQRADHTGHAGTDLLADGAAFGDHFTLALEQVALHLGGLGA